MSIKLVSTNPDYLEGTEPGVTYPFAISIWFNPSALNLDMVLASVADASVEDNYHALLFKGTLGTNRVHAVSDDAEAISAAGIGAPNVWYHILGVWNSASDRKIYLNGTNEGSDTTAKTIAGLDTLTVGRLGKLTPTNPTSGRMAHLTIWNLSTVFTAEERTQLGIIKVSPLLIRAGELVSYDPMPSITADPVVDTIGGFHLTQFGSPTTGENDPALFLPQAGQPEAPQISSINLSVVTSISFGQDAQNNIKVGIASSTLLFGQVADHNFKIGAASSALAFGQVALNNIKIGIASNSILFNQFESNNVQFHSAANAIAFDSPPVDTNIKALSAANSFNFGSFVGRHIEIEVISSFSFFHDAFTNVKFASAQSTVAFDGGPTSAGHEFNLSIIQEFLFEQAVRRTIDATATSSISFGQEAARRLDGLSELLFGQIVTVEQCKVAISEILFGQIVSFSHDRTLTPSNDLLFGQQVVGVLSSNCSEYEYSPNGLLPTITLGVRVGIRLESGAFNIELRNPQFGNTDEVDPKRIIRRSRGGTIHLVRDGIWPKKTTLNMAFTAITKIKAQEFITFLTNSIGQLTTLTDHENQTWDGVILNPNVGIADLQGDQDCNYSTELVFIGERT